jgi:hypothetical protein
MAEGDMTSLIIERLRPPTTAPDVRAWEAAWERAADAAAGRSLWSATGLPDGRVAVRRAGSLDAATRGSALGPEHDIAAVARDDVVVFSDPPARRPAETVRDRGAHAMLVVRSPSGSDRAAHAYLLTWGRGVAAAIPAAGVIAAKEFDFASRDLAWNLLLADILDSDRAETVGGVFCPRPAIGAR